MKKTLYIIAALTFAVMVFAPRPVYAETLTIADRDKFIHDLAVVFDISEEQVRIFLGLYKATEQGTVATPTPTPTPTLTPTPTPTPVPQRYNIGSTQGKLSFIRDHMDSAVVAGWLTRSQENAVMDKLEAMMQTAPTSSEFVAMSTKEQRTAINQWKKDMDAWCRTQGLTLAQLRDWTGKGNKFLMGIYID